MQVSKPPPVTASTPIGSIARDCPQAVAVFDRLGLDYCCRGKESVAVACSRAGVTLDEALRELARAESTDRCEEDWSQASLTRLCEHIEQTHHALARSLFDRLQSLLPRVALAHGAAAPRFEELRVVVAELREEMLDHMVREERVLFPWLCRLERAHAVTLGPPWSVRRPIDCMMHDHDSVAAGLSRIRSLTDGFTAPPGACASVGSLMNALRELDGDTRVHIHKENNILFPAGIRAEAARGRQRRSAPCGCGALEEGAHTCS